MIPEIIQKVCGSVDMKQCLLKDALRLQGEQTDSFERRQQDELQTRILSIWSTVITRQAIIE